MMMPNLEWILRSHPRGGQLGSVPYLHLDWSDEGHVLVAYIYYERNHYVVYAEFHYRNGRTDEYGDKIRYFRLEAPTEELAKSFVRRELYNMLGGPG